MKKRLLSSFLGFCIIILMLTGVGFGLITAQAANITTGRWILYKGESDTTGTVYTDLYSVFQDAYNYGASRYTRIHCTQSPNTGDRFDLGSTNPGYNLDGNRTLALTAAPGVTCTYYSGDSNTNLIHLQSGSTLYVGTGVTLLKEPNYNAVASFGGTLYVAGTITSSGGGYGLNAYDSKSTIYKLSGCTVNNQYTENGGSWDEYNAYKLTLSNESNVNSSSAAGYLALPYYATSGDYWYRAGTSATISADAATGYSITSASTVVINAATTHNVQASANVYSVTLKPNDGTSGTANDKTHAVTYNSPVSTISSANRHSRTGYALNGYFTSTSGDTKIFNANGSRVNNTTYINANGNWINAGDLTLYAQWTGNPYEVTLDAGEGSGGTQSVTATYGLAMPTTNVTMPTREGYTFAGYWTGKNGVGTRYYNTSGTSQNSWNIAAATTLYAKWVANPIIAINRAAVNERSANDGGVSDTIILTAQNGTFADNSGVTVSNVPTGLTPVITKIDNTSLMISFSGKAANHAISNTVSNATITVAAGKITYPLYTGANGANMALTTDSFSFVFRDAATAPNAPVFFGSDGMPGSAWADSVTLTSARLNSAVNITGGSITERGFVYGKVIDVSGEPRIGGMGVTKVQSGTGFGSFHSSITGLTADSEYIFAAYAITSSGGTYYSDSGSLRPSALCSMGTTSVLPIRDTQATIVGSVLTNGGSAITEVGVVYSTSPSPTVSIEESQGLSDGKVIFSKVGSQTGSYSVDLDNLDPASRYYVRTYAINASGVAYGAQVTMSTLDAGLTDSTYLSNLDVAGGTMVPAFNKDVHSYMVSVPSARNNIQVTPYLKDTNAATVQISVDGQSWLSVNGNSNKSGKQATITGINGSQINVVYIRVTDKSTGKVRTYILNMMMMPSNSADVINLTLREESETGTNIALTPGFDMNKSSYTAVVVPTVNEVYVEVDKGSNTWITTKINGVMSDNTDNPTSASRVVTLTGPSTQVTVQTTSQDGKTTKNYTVLIIRQTSSSAYLTELDVGETSGSKEYNAKLTPIFAPTQTSYGVAVGKETNDIWFTPKFDAGAVVSVSAVSANGTPLNVTGPDESKSFCVTGLVGGNNTVSITVTSPDGSTECAYTVTVTKKVSNITKLSGLTIKANTTSTNAISGAIQTLMPSFDADETAYTVVVENNMAFAHINPTKEDAGASYYFSGSQEYLAATTFSKNTPLVLPLSTGINEVFLHVVAADGNTVNTTAINIIRKVSSDATLSNITGVALEPNPFEKNQGVYSTEVEFSTTSANITATPTVNTSTITLTVNGVTQAIKPVGARTDNVALQSGINTLIYTVTAQDGVTTRQYTVELIRTASDNAWLDDLTFSPGGIADGTTYAKTAPNDGNTYLTGADDLGNTYYYYVDSDGDIVIAMEDYAGFDSYTLDYVEAVENNVESVTIKAIPKDENATMYYSIDGGESFTALTPDANSSEIPLDVGNNAIIVKVVAQDGETIKEYLLNVVRYGSDDCSLATSDSENPEDGGLWATNLTDPGLNPAYEPDTLTYTAKTEPRFDKTNITVKTNDANAKVFIKRQQREENGDQVTDTYGKPVVDTLISGVYGPVTASDAQLEIGDNIFFIEVVAANGSSQTYTLTITREAPYANLGAVIDPDEITFPEGLKKERSKTYILNHTTTGTQTITLTSTGVDKPIGPEDDISYSLGSFSDPDGVLTGKPELNDDGKTIEFTGATNIATGKTATLEIIIHTPNYEDKTVTLTFKTVDKTPVNITVNDNQPDDKEYDGNSAPKPGDSDLTIEDDGDTDRTNDITGNDDSEITYIYTGTDSKGEEYGPTTEPPIDAGEYELTITIIDEDYAGEEVIDFTIAKKALTIASASHTKAYDGTIDADGVTVTYSGVVAADASEVSPDTVTAEYTLSPAGTKTVDITEVTLMGDKAHNYKVTPVTSYTLTGTGFVGITKAPGLSATTPDDITIYEKLKRTKAGTVNLGDITLTAPFGVTGVRSYAAGTLSDGFNLFITSGKPAVSASTLSYTAAVGKAPNLTATQVITITTDNFEDITVTLTFKTIPRKALTITSDNNDLDKDYDGDDIVPPDIGDLTIKDGEDDISDEFSDGNVTYEYHGYDSEGTEYGPSSIPPSDAGDYTLTITVEDDEHTGELVIPFTIEKATPTVTVSSLSATYGETLSDVLSDMRVAAVAKISEAEISGTFTWTSGNVISVGNAGQRTHSVTFTPTDTKNYNIVYKDTVVSVAKATPKVTFPNASGAKYGDTLADVTLTGGSAQHSVTDTTLVSGAFSWNIPATLLDTSDSGTSYPITFTPDDTDNYEVVSGSVTVGTVAKADGLIVSLRDPILFIKEGANDEITYHLTSPSIMLSGPVGTPTNVKFEVTNVADAGNIFDGTDKPNHGSTPAVAAGSTELKYTPDGGQSENDTATITLKISSDNYSDITVTVQFVVIPLEAAFISGLTPEDGTYNGSAHDGMTENSELVITDADGSIITDQFSEADIIYTYTGRGSTIYSNTNPPTGAGDYKLTITVENSTHKGEKEINFSIAKATPTVNWPQDLTATYGETLSDVDLPTDNGTDTLGTFTWTDGDATSVGIVGSRQHNVTFTPSDAGNYETVNQHVAVEVAKADPRVTWPTGLSGTYGTPLEA